LAKFLSYTFKFVLKYLLSLFLSEEYFLALIDLACFYLLLIFLQNRLDFDNFDIVLYIKASAIFLIVGICVFEC